MKTQRNIITVIVIVAIGIILFKKREWFKSKLGIPPTTNVNNSSQPSGKVGITYKEKEKLPLYLGCKGSLVRLMQKSLNLKHSSMIQEDGYFGPLTELALIKAGYGKSFDSFDAYRLLN